LPIKAIASLGLIFGTDALAAANISFSEAGIALSAVVCAFVRAGTLDQLRRQHAAEQIVAQ
jgi:hypothetical protein